MPAFRRMLAAALVCVSAIACAQNPDYLAARRALGPHWKQMSRLAGQVFTGTVVSAVHQPANGKQSLSVVEVKLKVDRAIAGVQSGEVVILREWEGASQLHFAARPGQRMLLFLYPLSRLGLTSPVGGSSGQIALDSEGRVPGDMPRLDRGVTRSSRQISNATAGRSTNWPQLERAIRSIRKAAGKE